MAAGQGFKTFTTGEVLTAGDVNGYLMQGINVFASNAARDAAITSPQEGQFAYTKDTNSLWYYTGSAWAASGATGDIEGVTAGVGISGGGTSGTVTITNSMATAIDAKGDLVAGTAADTFSRLAVGANGTVLTADSAEATGLKWAAGSSGALTKITSATFTNVADTGTTFDNVFSSTYNNYVIVMSNINGSNNADLRFRLRTAGPTTVTSAYYGARLANSTLTTTSNLAQFVPMLLTTENASLTMTFSRDATPTQWSYYGFQRYSNQMVNGAAMNDTVGANAATGFILSADGGNIWGFVAVYGLAD